MPIRSTTPQRKKTQSKNKSSVDYRFFKLIVNFMVVCVFLLPYHYDKNQLMDDKNYISIYYNSCILVTVFYFVALLFKILDFILFYLK